MKKLLLITLMCLFHHVYAMRNEGLISLLEDNQSIITQKKCTITSLHRACISGDSARVKKKLASPRCKINKRGCFEENGKIMIGTPLFFACKWGHADIVKLLLEVPTIKVNKQDYYFDYGTPLHVAQTTKIAHLLYKHNADINATTQKSNRTPLIVHTLAKNRRMVELLVDCNAHVDHADCYNKNALVYAFSNSDHPSIAIIKKLLQAGADPIQAATRVIESRKRKDIHRLESICNDLPHKFNFYIFPMSTIGHHEQCPITLLQDNAALLKFLHAPLAKGHCELKSPHAKAFRTALATIQLLFTCCNGNTVKDASVKGHHAIRLHDRLFLYKALKKDLYVLFGEKSMNYAEELLLLYSSSGHISLLKKSVFGAKTSRKSIDSSNSLHRAQFSSGESSTSCAGIEGILLSSS